MKEIKCVSPSVEYRVIPYCEEVDKLSDFVIQKPKNAVDRIGSEPKHSGYEFL